MNQSTTSSKLLPELTCPSCWSKFAPSELKWVAAHPELIGDAKLGEHAARRFTPTRFDATGDALDQRETKCHAIACPRCHAATPRVLVETPPVFLSIVGAPACGKSYFLTSMAWQMRQSMPANFRVSITDADAMCNRILNDYEEQQFFNADRNAIVRLRKTEEQGDFYDSVNRDGQTISYPKPFLFKISPMAGHPNDRDSAAIDRLLCLYDNAGESFLPGRDSVQRPVTQHLGQASAMFFCFDPTQDPRMRAALTGKTDDFQVIEETVTTRQEILFQEMVARFKRLSGTAASQMTDRPVVIVVTKFDVWKSLFGDAGATPHELLPMPIRTKPDGSLSAIDLTQIRKLSDKTREILFRYSPELVSSAEAFSHHVTYLPVTATGRSPAKDPETGITGIRPSEIDPVGCDVPLLWTLAAHGQGLIPYVGDSESEQVI